MNPQIDNYLAVGCGRCPLGGTPQCKVHNWTDELEHLRSIVLQCGLTEELKWSMPCYTFQGKNVVMVSAFKEYASLSFFKGSLLKDPDGLLDKPGENSQAARLIKFTSVRKVKEMEPALKSFIKEAVANEKAGKKVNFKEKHELQLPNELQLKFEENPALKAAFESLTPGRQRGYVLYFSAPKQSATRISRIEKYMPKIFTGKGVHDR